MSITSSTLEISSAMGPIRPPFDLLISRAGETASFDTLELGLGSKPKLRVLCEGLDLSGVVAGA